MTLGRTLLAAGGTLAIVLVAVVPLALDPTSTTEPTDSHKRVFRPAAPAPAPDYDRDMWGGWLDLDEDCQDTRVEVLLAYADHVRLSEDGCDAVGVILMDPYQTQSYVGPASDIDIDHVVSLREAHDSGGQVWPLPTRLMFANDMSNLLPTAASRNRSKGAKDAAGWMPAIDQCDFAARVLKVKGRYGLTIDRDEMVALSAACETPLPCDWLAASEIHYRFDDDGYMIGWDIARDNTARHWAVHCWGSGSVGARLMSVETQRAVRTWQGWVP